MVHNPLQVETGTRAQWSPARLLAFAAAGVLIVVGMIAINMTSSSTELAVVPSTTLDAFHQWTLAEDTATALFDDDSAQTQLFLHRKGTTRKKLVARGWKDMKKYGYSKMDNFFDPRNTGLDFRFGICITWSGVPVPVAHATIRVSGVEYTVGGSFSVKLGWSEVQSNGDSSLEAGAVSYDREGDENKYKVTLKSEDWQTTRNFVVWVLKKLGIRQMPLSFALGFGVPDGAIFSIKLQCGHKVTVSHILNKLRSGHVFSDIKHAFVDTAHGLRERFSKSGVDEARPSHSAAKAGKKQYAALDTGHYDEDVEASFSAAIVLSFSGVGFSIYTAESSSTEPFNIQMASEPRLTRGVDGHQPHFWG